MQARRGSDSSTEAATRQPGLLVVLEWHDVLRRVSSNTFFLRTRDTAGLHTLYMHSRAHRYGLKRTTNIDISGRT